MRFKERFIQPFKANLPVLVVALSPFLLYGWRLLAGQVFFWGTPALQFVPWAMEAFRQLLQGSLPLWNPMNGAGAPLLANYQTAFFYPPNWLLLLFAGLGGGAGLAEGYSFLALAHLAWAGIGTVVLLRRLGSSPFAQMIAGMAFGLSGYLVARLEFYSMILAAAWLPWILVYANDLVRLEKDERPRLPFFFSIPLSICIGLQLLSGHAQVSWYSLLFAGMWVLAGALRGERKTWVKPLLSFGAAALAGALLASVQLLPTAEYLLQSQRSTEVGYKDAMLYSFWPWRLLTLFAPDIFGNPGRGDFWGYASYWEDALYIGMLPLLLALSSLPSLLRKKLSPSWGRKGLLVFLWSMILVSVLFALGENTPIFPFLYRYVPTFSMFQAPARYLLWAEMAMVILAAWAVDRWRCPENRGLYWLRLGTMGAFAITVGAGLAWWRITGVNLTFIRATALAGLWALGTGTLTLLIPFFEKRGWKRTWMGLVVVWLLADLLSANWLLNPTVSASMYAQTTPSIFESGRIYLPSDVEYKLKFKRFLRFKDYRPLEDWTKMRAVLLPNTNLLAQFPLLNNFDPMLPGRYVAWVAALEKLPFQQYEEWLRMAGVSAVESLDTSQADGVRLDAIKNPIHFAIYPCADFVADGDTALAELQSSSVSAEWLVLEGTSAEQGCAEKGGLPLQAVEQKADYVRLRVDNPTDGYLYAAMAFYPGWEASVDSRSVPIYHANYLFMAVPVSQGKHEIILQYRSRPFYIGALLSILVLVAYLFWNRQRVYRRSN
jgi:hypothetical protein